jgi:hypothetical protein
MAVCGQNAVASKVDLSIANGSDLREYEQARTRGADKSLGSFYAKPITGINGVLSGRLMDIAIHKTLVTSFFGPILSSR